jgi:hypothetical protein
VILKNNCPPELVSGSIKIRIEILNQVQDDEKKKFLNNNINTTLKINAGF